MANDNHRNRNSFQPYTQSTALSTALPGAPMTGTSQGSANSFKKSTKVLERSRDANKVLLSIQAAFNAYEEGGGDELGGLKIFENVLKESLPALEITRDGVASVTENMAWAFGSVFSHGIQSFLDSSIGVSAITKFISNNQNEILTQSQASLLGKLEQANNNFSANCKRLSEIVHSEGMNQVMSHLDDHLNPYYGEDHFALTHKSIARTTANIGTITSVAPFATLSAGLDLLSHTLREIQASFLDTANLSEHEQKVFEALSECVQSVSEDIRNSNAAALNSLDKINQLIDALKNPNEPRERLEKQSVTGSRPHTAFTFLTSSIFVESLKSIVLSALTVIESIKALEQGKDKLTDASKNSFTQASKLEGISLNVSDLTDGFNAVNDALKNALNENALKKDHSTIESAAGSSHAFSKTILLLPSLLTGLSALVSRELKGATVFVKDNEGSGDESRAAFKSDENCGEELDKLLSAAIKTKDGLEEAQRLKVCLPTTISSSRAVTFGTLASALNTSLGMVSAVRELISLVQNLKTDDFRPDENEEKAAEDMADRSQRSHQESTKNLPERSTPTLLTGFDAVMQNLILTSRITRPMNTGDITARKNLNSTGKSIVQSEHGTVESTKINSGFLTGALAVTALFALESGISAEVIMRTIAQSIESVTLSIASGREEVFNGPDRFELLGAQSNLSFASNILRSIAQTSDELYDANFFPYGSLYISTELTGKFLSITVWVAELILSRSLTIALIQHGLLTEAVKELTQKKQIHSNLAYSDGSTSNVSANVMPELADLIENKLNEIDNRDAFLKNLNFSVGAQLHSVSWLAITSALSAHSTLILPFLTTMDTLKATAAMDSLQAGSRGRNAHKDEALIESRILKTFSEGLNTIQGFTHACINHLDNETKTDQNQNSTSSKHTSATTFLTSGLFSLLLEELVEMTICRSFTLLNKAAIQESTKASNKALSEEVEHNTKISTEAVSDDSHSQQKESVLRSHSLSALRLTLTRLGEMLSQCAGKLEKEVVAIGGNDVVQKLEMHRTQATLMRSMASALTQFSALITRSIKTTGGLSLLPILSRDNADALRKKTHSTDQNLQSGPVNSSKDEIETDNDYALSISIPIAAGIDLSASAVLNVIKTLFKASLIGSDVSLSVAKVLEIISLHEHPDDVSRLETQASIKPAHGNLATSKNALSAIFAAIPIHVGGSTGMILDQDEYVDMIANTSFTTMQKMANNIIDQIQVLKDEEEGEQEEEKKDENNVIGLKAYFKQLIIAVGGYSDQNEVNQLVDMFDKGGVRLAQYHERYSGIPRPPHNQALLENDLKFVKLYGVHDATSLIDAFIDIMFKDSMGKRDASQEGQRRGNPSVFPKLTHFIHQLGNQLTSETQALHQHIVERIASQLHRAKNISRATFFGKPREYFDKNAFISEFTNLANPGNEEARPVEIKPEPSIQCRLKDLDAARVMRAQNRAARKQTRAAQRKQAEPVQEIKALDEVQEHQNLDLGQ